MLRSYPLTVIPLIVRRGEAAEIPEVAALYDAAVAWLVEIGSSGQWGTEPLSARPGRMATYRTWVAERRLWVAEAGDDAIVGAIALGTPPPYVEAVAEPELYVMSFVTDRSRSGRGIGRALLEHARTQARELGVGLFRVDCWGGGDGALVHYYERAGFTRTLTFSVLGGDWPCQVLEQRI